MLDGLGCRAKFLVVAQGRLVVVDIDIPNAAGPADGLVVTEEGCLLYTSDAADE